MRVVDLNVAGHGRADAQAGETLREVGEQPAAQRIVRCEQLQLLDAPVLLPQIRLELVDRRAQTAHHAQRMIDGDKCSGVFLHTARHPAPVVLIAVVDHGEAVEILQDPQRRFQRDFRRADGFFLADIIDLRTVDGDGEVQKRQLLNDLGHTGKKAARRRYDLDASSRRGIERITGAQRQLLLGIQQRPVQIERQQLHRLHKQFSPFHRFFAPMIAETRNKCKKRVISGGSCDRIGAETP